MYGNMIEEFNGKNAMAFKQAMEEGLQKVADKFGVKVKIDQVTLNSRTLMSMSVKSSVGLEVRLEEMPSGRLFLAYCEYYDIPKDKLGKTVNLKGTLYRVTGWSPNARKYKVQCERVSDGKTFMMTPSTVKSLAR